MNVLNYVSIPIQNVTKYLNICLLRYKADLTPNILKINQNNITHGYLFPLTINIPFDEFKIKILINNLNLPMDTFIRYSNCRSSQTL